MPKSCSTTKVQDKSKPKPMSTLKTAANPTLKSKAEEPTTKTKTDVKAEIKLAPEGDVHSTTGKYDSHVFFVHCVHDKVLLTRRNNVRWMPFIESPANCSWKDGALLGFCQVLAASDKAKFEKLAENPPFKSYKCMQLLRLQMPQTLKFIKRAIYYFKINPEATNFKCCQDIAPHFEWFPLTKIRSGQVPHLWGPELIECCKCIADSAKQNIAEYSLDEAYMYVPRDPPRNFEEEMLMSLRLTQSDVERLYADFVEHCFPSFYQTLDSFRVYMSKYNFEKDKPRVAKLFDAFNSFHNGYLSFHEMLLGLACLEPSATHGEFRAKFLFRYYDFDHTGLLNDKKLKAMIADMHPEETNLDDKLTDAMNAIGGSSVVGRFSVNLKDFLAAVGSHQFRGTSGLCRLPKGIFAEISRSLAIKHLKRVNVKKVLSKALPKRAHKGVCPTCIERKFQVASHMATVDIDGKMTHKRLPEVEMANAPDAKTQCPTAQQYSIECIFRPFSAANAMITMLREFAKNKGTAAKPKALLQNRKEDLWKLLLQLYQELCILLDEEFKCQKTYSPCYIIGDIHGNIEDLLSMEKTLWPLMPIVGAGIVFLGDYVDRGQWGLECSLYVAAFKILCPNKVTMMRGNHEVRSLQKHYSYFQECISKYGEEYGFRIFELTNRIYDKLPVCSVVDDAIYCAHGGIPHAVKTLDQIAAIKRQIREPEEESTTAWEILWSDPCGQQEFLDTCEVCRVNPDSANGFVFNTKRGTAYKFSEVAANGFMRDNMLTHIIRAHEVAPLGYEFHFNTKCVTIFSSSHYCGNDNQCGFILADNQRMRVIHLDTAANNSATD